jgi:hypothetical protein
MPPRLLRALTFLAAALAAVLFLLWLAQRRLLYFPQRSERAADERRARSLGLEPWTDPGGGLLGWRARHRDGARGRLVVLHGNAGSALDRSYFVAALASAAPSLPLDVYLVEYPGYGARPGSPSQASLVSAARAAIAAARREGPGPLLLAGESLGSAVAAIAAAEGPGVDGLLLVTPLASVPAVARRHYPFVPALVHRDAYRADLALPRWGGRVAFLVAGRDEVVFADLGRALFDAYPGSKRLWLEDGATHNALDWRPDLPRWREVVEFLAAGR